MAGRVEALERNACKFAIEPGHARMNQDNEKGDELARSGSRVGFAEPGPIVGFSGLLSYLGFFF